jgi:hypothetical protein
MKPEFNAIYLLFLKFGGLEAKTEDFIKNNGLYWDFIRNFQKVQRELKKYEILNDP